MKRWLIALAAICCLAAPAGASVRIKDITFPRGVRDYQLLGYGLVVGLQGSGDTLRNSPFTEQAAASMLDRLGINVRGNVNDPFIRNNIDPNARNNALRTRNIAAVLVTASLPPFVGWGSTIDVTVSSLGDATSLMGGTLISTTLNGLDGNTYAIAQGPVTVSGSFAAKGQTESLTHGVATAGRVPNGATIEREPPRPATPGAALVLELRNPDFETAARIADAINNYLQKRYKSRSARELDNRSVSVTFPPQIATARFMAEIGELRVEANTPAKVVIDERSGTVIIGHDVQISPVAVTHGGLTVRVSETLNVSQPPPLSRGRTAITPQTSITATEEGGQVATLAGPTLQTLVRGLNQIGLRPTGIIAILQAIKSAGALQAELVIQ